ncbi:hypothetical protein BGZ65_003514 [Modicella reniformis]|uniref:Uncharacterized protein n=1 Tax=Modicella reniformis TaxID=1440133 RepID=A0A9P6ING0_9FUNG|nr:hypothetical protein BGZ65_003514 [Modicella reniformis]
MSRAATYLATDGIQAHLQAFDITKGHTSSKIKACVVDIKKRFPDKDSVIEAFGQDHKNTVIVCGVDPGEKVSASFCSLDPTKKNEVSNLLVKRSALYQPTFAYRATDKKEDENQQNRGHEPTVWSQSGMPEQQGDPIHIRSNAVP